MFKSRPEFSAERDRHNVDKLALTIFRAGYDVVMERSGGEATACGTKPYKEVSSTNLFADTLKPLHLEADPNLHQKQVYRINIALKTVGISIVNSSLHLKGPAPPVCASSRKQWH